MRALGGRQVFDVALEGLEGIGRTGSAALAILRLGDGDEAAHRSAGQRLGFEMGDALGQGLDAQQDGIDAWRERGHHLGQCAGAALVIGIVERVAFVVRAVFVGFRGIAVRFRVVRRGVVRRG